MLHSVNYTFLKTAIHDEQMVHIIYLSRTLKQEHSQHFYSALRLARFGKTLVLIRENFPERGNLLYGTQNTP